MDNDGGITDSDTSSDTKSKVSFNDIVSSRGPYAYLLQWYDDRFDESVPEFKFNKRIVSKSKASKKRPSNSKQVPTLQLGFALLLSTVGSVADNKRKEKRNVRSDKSKEFPNPPPGFPLRIIPNVLLQPSSCTFFNPFFDCIFNHLLLQPSSHLQTPGSGISILLAVGTPSTGSGNSYFQWELSPGSGNALCILFPT
nr:hypothetical protein [Tanacetum cinerariifolium]